MVCVPAGLRPHLLVGGHGLSGAGKVASAMNDVPPIMTETVYWTPERAVKKAAWKVPDLAHALTRGLACTCPSCGKTKLFTGYLRVVDACADCGAPLGSLRADDAPPYFTIFIVGHIVVPLMLIADMHFDIPDWIQASFWVPVSGLLALALLRPVKGATVGVMMRLGMAKAGENG